MGRKTTATMVWAIGLLLCTEAGLRVRAWHRLGSQTPVADIYQADDASGRRLRPGAVLHGSERRLSINRFGFRGPDISLPKPSGTLRIAVLGDSTTFGMEASDDASVWVERMVAELNGRSSGGHFDAINGGVPGYALADSIRLLDARIAALEPDIVVIEQVATDIAAHARRQFGKSAKAVALSASLAGFFQKHSLLVNLLRQNTAALNARLIPQRRHDRLDNRGVEEYSARLAGLIDVCQRNGRRVVLCTAPRSFGDPSASTDQFTLAASALAHNPALSLAAMNDAFDRYNDAIRRVARVTNTPLVDLDRLVPRRAEYFVDAVHLNNAGHTQVGDLVARTILRTYADPTFVLGDP
jgi:lysophospholipase L1-like esterase